MRIRFGDPLRSRQHSGSGAMRRLILFATQRARR
jgi:hypothetical protein